MLIDLIEHLEAINGFELIQSNTDGLIVALPDTDEAFYQMDDICAEWEERCNMELEFDCISSISQKDVNNYVFQFDTGKLERKGAYVKELSPLDYDLPIVNKAVVDKLIYGIPVEKTIAECDDLKEFQMVKKISSLFDHMLHGGYFKEVSGINPKTGKRKKRRELIGERVKLKEKCVRVYASKDPEGGLWKVKENGHVAKVEGTPVNCFIWNEDVNGVRCPPKLDKGWYIELAKKRLEGFGVI